MSINGSLFDCNVPSGERHRAPADEFTGLCRAVSRLEAGGGFADERCGRADFRSAREYLPCKTC
jgi:hypothetical protein